MVLCKKSEAVTTLKNGKEKLNKGYREIETKTGRKMYMRESKPVVVPTKKVVRKSKPQSVDDAVDEPPSLTLNVGD